MDEGSFRASQAYRDSLPCPASINAPSPRFVMVSAPGVVHDISAMFRRPGGRAMDRTTERLSAFVCDLHYHDLTPQTVHQVKRVLVDTLACAMGGYLSEPA